MQTIDTQNTDRTPKVALLLIGSELLDGRILDTNKRYLGKALSDLGLSLVSAVTARDSIQEICEALDFLSSHSDYIICSGGLGPTTDDLTREAVASYLNVPVILDQQVLDNLHALYRKRNRSFDPSNTKQATFPKGSEVIPNPVGTAAGFLCVKNCLSGAKAAGGSTTIISLPGVPKELYAMTTESVIPLILKNHIGFKVLNLSSIRLFGLPESAVGSKVTALNLPESVSISYLASFPEVKVTLKTRESPEVLNKHISQVRSALGEEYIFSDDLSRDLPLTINKLLCNSGKSISVAESCTAGMIGAALTEYAGSSVYFLGGIQSYDNAVKVNQLGVNNDTIDKFGAVSHATACEMARNVRIKFQSSVGLSITGISGPDGGSPEKPVGTFFIGISSGSGTKSMRFFFLASRDFIRTYCVYKALDVLRRDLLALPDPADAVSVFEFKPVE